MDIFLQAWGGGFYLLNKICFSVAENREAQAKRSLKMAGWIIFMLGMPPWLIILVGNNNWIIAATEVGAIPAMLLGLYNTYYNNDKTAPILFTAFVRFCTYFFIAVGLTYSVYVHGGITTATQVLEIAVITGFLLGSYLLAQNNSIGWLFFMLMNASTAILMLINDKPILLGQQLVSLGFVIYGYVRSRINHGTEKSGLIAHTSDSSVNSQDL
jgi:hypothetical protein